MIVLVTSVQSPSMDEHIVISWSGWIQSGEGDDWQESRKYEMERELEAATVRLKKCPEFQIPELKRMIHQIKSNRRLSRDVMLSQYAHNCTNKCRCSMKRFGVAQLSE